MKTLRVGGLVFGTCALLLCGCGSVPREDSGRAAIFEAQTKLGTTSRYHSPNAGFEGYVVAIEKTKHGLGRSADVVLDYAGEEGGADTGVFQADALRNTLRVGANSKVHFVSQVVRLDAAGGRKEPQRSAYRTAWAKTYLYDVYSEETPLQLHLDETEDWDSSSMRRMRAGKLVSASSRAILESLGKDLDKRLDQTGSEPFTHVIVMSTGWNTHGWESMVNYTDWYETMTKAAAPRRFRPLVIGFSWVSDWSNAEFGRFMLPVASFANKADDADEIGATWGALVVHRVARPIAHRHGLPVIVIGHSFGARLLSRSLNSAAVVMGRDEKPEPVDLFVGLQGAFTINRFIKGEGREGSPYAETFENAATQWAFVGSSHDEAVGTAPVSLWSKVWHLDSGRGLYVGDPKAGRIAAQSSWLAGKVSLATAGGDGLIIEREPQGEETSKLLFVDASAFVNTNPWMTGGGAHSDVYDAEMGRLLWSMLYRQAPGPVSGSVASVAK